jgi:hypothetical protein
VAAWCAVVSIVTLLLGGMAAPAGAGTIAQLLRYPYLTDGTSSAVVVNFATDSTAPAAAVVFGPSGGSCATSVADASATAIVVNGKNEVQFQAHLTGLSPNTSYCYRIVQDGTDLLSGGASPSFTTATAAADSTPYSFAVIGDWGAGTPDEANVLAQIANSPAKFVVTVGDNAYNSETQTEYGDLLGGNVFAPNYWKNVGASRPVYPAQGNHGLAQSLPYLQNFPEPDVVNASGGRLTQDNYCCIPPMAVNRTFGSAWYAFDWGPARYYVLQAAWADGGGGYAGDFYAHWNGPVPGCAACGTELQWLQTDLVQHASTPLKLAFFHYPLYSDSPAQSSDTYLQGANRLEGLLAKNNVSVVFNGHAHIYERNRPQIPGSPMVSYVTGGGGAALGSIGCSGFDAYAVGMGRSCNAPAPTSSAQVFHFLLVTVNGTSVTVTPTDSTGRTFDVQTYTRNAAPVTALDSRPAALTNATSATFAFHSNVAGATFSCTLDGGTATACTSPTSFTALTSVAHTFTVATTAPSGPAPPPVSAAWTVDTSPPSTPTGTTATASSPTRVDVSWTASTDNTGVTAYVVARDGTYIGLVTGATNTFSDTSASPSTTYQYTVIAFDGAGNISGPSAPAAVTTLTQPTVTTPPPTTVTTTPPTTVATTPLIVTPTPLQTGWFNPNFVEPTTTSDQTVFSPDASTGPTQPVAAVGDSRSTANDAGASSAAQGSGSGAETSRTPNRDRPQAPAERPSLSTGGQRSLAGWSMYWLMFVLGIAGAALAYPILLLVGRHRRHRRTPEAPLAAVASEATHPSMLVDSRVRSYLGPDEYALACAYVSQGGSEVSDLYVVLTPRNLWWFRFASMDADQAAIVWATSLSPIHITTLEVDESAGTTRIVYEGGEIAWRWSRGSGARKLMLMLRDLFDPATGIVSLARKKGKANPPKDISE